VQEGAPVEASERIFSLNFSPDDTSPREVFIRISTFVGECARLLATSPRHDS
jgi:hypothetical protein